MHRRNRLLLVAAGALLLTSCSYIGGRTEPPYPSPRVVETPHTGRVLYMRDCAWCHGNRGEGTTRAPDLVSGRNGPAFSHFMLSTGRMPIENPRDSVTHSEPLYPPEQIADVVEFVESLGTPGPPIPTPDPEAGDLSLGAELYQQHCAACHSTTGIGGALTTGRPGELEGATARKSGIIAPDLSESTPTQIAEAMLVGPGTMPVFSRFSDEEVDSIARYVTYLQDPADPGGAEIGRVGPVAEGAVGWIVGMGLLLVVIRWIGTKVGEE